MIVSPFRVALVREIFLGDDAQERLAARLTEARSEGAELVLLPELPLNPWSPATAIPRDEDAEPPEGPRHRALSAAARQAGIAVLGGAILCDPATGKRHNVALLFDAAGRLAGSYAKLHLPDEEGFFEPAHYEPGSEPPAVLGGLGIPVGVQVCSDSNRPEGSHLLGALGAEVILVPRATEASTWERWKTVLRANALTSGAYVLSVSRPAPEFGVPLGGPSVAIAPDGEILVETTAPLAVVDLDRGAVAAARKRYPGYLAVRADIYARAWGALAAKGITQPEPQR
jgi:N-carbamoylputrescine amidase